MTDRFKIDKSIALKEAHIEQKAIEKAHVDQETLEKAQVPKDCEVSVSYVYTTEKQD